MNVQFLTPNILNKKYNNSTVIGANYPNLNHVSPVNLQPLKKDTVSFTGAKEKAVNTIADHVKAKVDADSERMNRIATVFLDVLESVANKLGIDGVSFDRAYCEQNPVKSSEAYVSKILRSGSMKVPDQIRATLYLDDISKLDVLFDKILPEMKLRGYVVADADMSIADLIKRGYIPTEKDKLNLEKRIPVPDLDIRVNDVTDQIPNIPTEYRYSVSKGQKSGYEDIQLRFVRDFANKRNPILHELIILSGPNTAMAKHIESSKVYTHLRRFAEFSLDMSDESISQPAKQVERYQDLISQMFRGKVSQKLFLNAKNKDAYGITDEIPISFSQEDIALFNTYFERLQKSLSDSYKILRQNAKSSDSALKEINRNARSDLKILNEIKEELNSTIEYFNYQHGLKEIAN